LVVRIGLIGYKNHAARLRSIIDKKKDSKIIKIYHPNKNTNDEKFTNDITELFDSDAIIIASPNNTHVNYIKKLVNNFNGYIFCEKPPAMNKIELKYLKNISINKKNKIFFNFNFRFSKMNKIIQQNLNTKTLGKIIKIDINASQGLAFKKEYLKSWRANGKTNLHNIIETVAIHYLDLLNLHYNVDKVEYHPLKISKNGSSYDTSHLIITIKNDIIATIFNSYATPLLNEIKVIGTNGYLSTSKNYFEIYSPRNTFDSKKFFISPPLKKRLRFNFKENYDESLKKSIEFFVSNVKKNNKIDLKYYKASIKTNEQILNLN